MSPKDKAPVAGVLPGEAGRDPVGRDLGREELEQLLDEALVDVDPEEGPDLTEAEDPVKSGSVPGGEPGDHPDGGDDGEEEASTEETPPKLGLFGRRKKRTGTLQKKEATPSPRYFKPRQRMLLLDTWIRSKLPATEFGPLVGLTASTLYHWRKAFLAHGPAGLEDHPRKSREGGGTRIPEETRRAILLLKEQNPDWGVERLHLVLMRSQGHTASPAAIAVVLKANGYERQEAPTKPHAPRQPRFFERANPNDLWQSDLFTFILKRENRRVYLVAFLDDHSRFIVGYGLHATQSGALVREVFKAAVVNFGAPKEVLTDNGTQYHTWQGKSVFTQNLEKLGIRHIVAAPRHPETLGKTERFWGTLWRECVESAVFQGLEDARARIGHFIDHYNFQRPHQGIEGAVPADRYFSAAGTVKATLLARVAANAKELALHGLPRKSFYLTGRVGDQSISLHAEGDRVVMTQSNGTREEVVLSSPGRRTDPEAAPTPTEGMPSPVACQGIPRDLPGEEEDSKEGAPGSSPLDAVLVALGKEGLPLPVHGAAPDAGHLGRAGDETSRAVANEETDEASGSDPEAEDRSTPVPAAPAEGGEEE